MRAALLVVLPLSVALAGCGGGGALTRAQYLSKVDAACEAFHERESEIGEPKTVRDLALRGPKILAVFDDTLLEEVASLDPPKAIAGQARRLVAVARLQRATLVELVQAAQRHDLSDVQQLQATNAALNKQAAALARKLGASRCAQGS